MPRRYGLHLLLLSAVIWLARPATAAQPPTPSDEPPAGTLIVHPEDGALMTWVPAGTFIMGMDADEAAKLAQAWGYKHYQDFAAEEWFPRRQVWLPGFFIDIHEVTVQRWRRFVQAADYVSPLKAKKYPDPPADAPQAFDLYPVATVRWDEAQKYANYFGKALPREAQWEKAARGTDGRWFPWGNELPAPDMGAFSPDIMGTRNTRPSPVGSFPRAASPYGCLDMVGNVYEWTSDWFEPYPNNPQRHRLLGYTGHTNGVLRGGSFYHTRHALCSAKRFGFPPAETHFHVGFRTVWEPPAGYFKSAEYDAARAAVPGRQAELEALRQQALEAPRTY